MDLKCSSSMLLSPRSDHILLHGALILGLAIGSWAQHFHNSRSTFSFGLVYQQEQGGRHTTWRSTSTTCTTSTWSDPSVALTSGSTTTLPSTLARGRWAFGFDFCFWLLWTLVWDQDGTGPTLDKLVPLLEQGGYHYHIWGGLAHIFIRLFRSDSIMFHSYH